MKRILLFCAAVALCVSFAACGIQNTSSESSGQTTASITMITIHLYRVKPLIMRQTARLTERRQATQSLLPFPRLEKNKFSTYGKKETLLRKRSIPSTMADILMTRISART